MIKYRPDIDGLRAVAVLAVIVYHAEVPWLPGGFAGVDVFFVISGYLIAAITLAEMAKGTFSLASFYERRARRIFPPLIAVLLTTAALGYFWLLPSELKGLGRASASAALFIANFHFWQTGSYFTPAAESSPLLHTWSLAVEEQYYLVFPLIMMALHKRRRLLLGVTSALALISFGLAVHGVRNEPTAAFYLPHMRAWELLVGALLAMGVLPSGERLSSKLRSVLGLFGLVCMGASFVFLRAGLPFPGEKALLPCLGAVAVIYAGTGGTGLVNRWLSHKLMVGIGLISYGLYLWHWPLLSLARRVVNGELTPLAILVALALTLALTLLSYYTLEKGIRTRAVFSTRRAIFAASFLGLAACWGVSSYLTTHKGLPGRLPAEARKLDALKYRSATALKSVCNKKPTSWGCTVGDAKAKPSFLVWGDSHAGMEAPAFAESAKRAGKAGLIFSQPGCTPIEGVRLANSTRERCTRFRDSIYRAIKKHKIKHVIFASRWAMWTDGRRYGSELGQDRILRDKKVFYGSYKTNPQVMERGMAKVIDKLKKQKVRVSIVAGVPELRWLLTQSTARAIWLGRALDARPTRAEHDERQHEAMKMFARLKKRFGVKVVDPSAAFCDAEYCTVQQNKELFYYDNNHLTLSGTERLVPALEPLFAAPARSEPAVTAQGT